MPKITWLALFWFFLLSDIPLTSILIDRHYPDEELSPLLKFIIPRLGQKGTAALRLASGVLFCIIYLQIVPLLFIFQTVTVLVGIAATFNLIALLSASRTRGK